MYFLNTYILVASPKSQSSFQADLHLGCQIKLGSGSLSSLSLTSQTRLVKLDEKYKKIKKIIFRKNVYVAQMVKRLLDMQFDPPCH